MTDARIGRYRVEAVIGTGAFATVYRAVDERLDDTVAIKVLADNHSLDPEMRERFLTEGRVLRRIDSPHVVRVHDLGETGRGQPYLVLEYADQGALEEFTCENHDDLRAVVRPLAAALGVLHAAEVVHRDISPGNVLLTADGRPLLADLGLCKDLAVNSGYTVAGGTEGFRAPEQRSGPVIVTPATDLWSLSALMTWLITGSPPRGASVRPAVVKSGWPAALGTVLDKSLADDPAERHSDVADWLNDVEAALNGKNPLARRRPRVLVSVAAVLASLGLILGWNQMADQAREEGIEMSFHEQREMP